MKKIFGILFVVVTVVALLAIPAVVSAETAPTTDSGWEMVKWQDNPNSWYLYLQNWGRTPTAAMSRLAGMGPQGEKNALCSTTQCTPCDSCAADKPAWGVSLCFANKSWSGADLQDEKVVRTWNPHPNHFGTACSGGSCSGGDWGVSGCAAPKAVANTWCMTDNLVSGGSSTCIRK